LDSDVSTASTYILDLRDTIRTLIADLSEPDEIWLFGSRAHRSRSQRSDLDLLVIDTEAALATNALIGWRASNRSRAPIDFFVSRDRRTADSVVNGSVLNAEDLPGRLDAILLWRRTQGFPPEEEIPWLQEFRHDVEYHMTSIPTNFLYTLELLPVELERLGLPNVMLGMDWYGGSTKLTGQGSALQVGW
jgi:predicted nucleotidyltransferase